MSRLSRYRKRKYEAIQRKNIVEEPAKVTKRKFNIWGIFGVIASITVIILAINPIRDLFLTKKEKWDKENTEQGTIKFPEISTPDSSANDTIELKRRFIYNHQTYHYPEVKGIYIKNLENISAMHEIFFVINGNAVGVRKVELDKGIDINLFGMGCWNIPALMAIAIKNRVYISAKFFDLITDDEIGEMEFNHWKIYHGEFMDYTTGDDRFEVKDKHGNIVFSIADASSKGKVGIAVSGYFNYPNNVSIYSNELTPHSCIQKTDTNWLKIAEAEIAKIKSVFPVKK